MCFDGNLLQEQCILISFLQRKLFLDITSGKHLFTKALSSKTSSVIQWESLDRFRPPQRVLREAQRTFSTWIGHFRHWLHFVLTVNSKGGWKGQVHFSSADETNSDHSDFKGEAPPWLQTANSPHANLYCLSSAAYLFFPPLLGAFR